MSRVYEPTDVQERGWREWVAERPANVRAVAERFDPWSLYLMKSSDHIVSVVSFGEADDGEVTLTVNVSGDYNVVLFEREVFGVDPDDLVPCDPPAANAATGALLSGDEVDANLDQLRVLVRPDLWSMDADGTANRKN